jgi:hypothetical protein
MLIGPFQGTIATSNRDPKTGNFYGYVTLGQSQIYWHSLNAIGFIPILGQSVTFNLKTWEDTASGSPAFNALNIFPV